MISQHVIRYRRYDISGVRDIAAMIIIMYAGDIVAAISPTPERSGDITRAPGDIAAAISRTLVYVIIYILRISKTYIYNIYICIYLIYLHISHIYISKTRHEIYLQR